ADAGKRDAPDDVFDTGQFCALGVAERTVAAVYRKPAQSVAPGRNGDQPMLDELVEQLARLQPAFTRIDVVLEHVAGDAQVVDGIVGGLFDLSDLAKVEPLLATLGVFEAAAAARAYERHARNCKAWLRPIRLDP